MSGSSPSGEQLCRNIVRKLHRVVSCPLRLTTRAEYPQVIAATLKPLRNFFLADPGSNPANPAESQRSFCLGRGINKLHPLLSGAILELRIEAMKVLVSLGISDDLIRKIIVASKTVPLLLQAFGSSDRALIELTLKVACFL